MGDEKKKEVKRELILALMFLMIFVSLLVTWTILGAIDQYTSGSAVSERSPSYNVPQGTGRVALTIRPLEEIEGGG
jgi:capsule polysaccharide export protein KpsE/RkpR